MGNGLLVSVRGVNGTIWGVKSEVQGSRAALSDTLILGPTPCRRAAGSRTGGQ